MKKSMMTSMLLGGSLLVASNASAIELFKDDKTLLTMGGYVETILVYEDQEDEWDVNNGASRINFKLNRTLSEDLEGFGVIEWGLNLADGTSSYSFRGDAAADVNTDEGDTIWLRLGFVGLKSDWGSISMGKQWGVYYDIGGWTDLYQEYGGLGSGVYTLGGDGSISGTGRADEAIIFRNQYGKIGLGLQTQLKGDTEKDVEDIDGNVVGSVSLDSSFGTSITYAMTDNLTLGVAYNYGDTEGTVAGESLDDNDDEAWILGFKWTVGSWYVSAVYTQSEYHEQDETDKVMEEAFGGELYVSNRIGQWLPYFGFNYLESDETDNDYVLEQYLGGLQYFYTDQVSGYVEGRLEEGELSTGEDKEADAILFGLKVDF